MGQWVVGDRADFEYRIVGDYDCYASFGDDASSGSSSTIVIPSYTSSPVLPSYTPSPTYYSGGSSGSSSCAVSSNWGSMKINPYWGSTTSFLSAMIYNAPVTITSFSSKAADKVRINRVFDRVRLCFSVMAWEPLANRRV